MDIVDTHIHFTTMDENDAVKVMDHLGIRSALIDEAWNLDDEDAASGDDGGSMLMPSYRLPGGVSRPVSPGGIAASLRRPDRFAYFLRINPEDPDLDFVMRHAAASPGGRAFRYDCRSPREVDVMVNGGRLAMFKAAERLAMPMFICAIGGAAAFESCIRACPSLPIVFDHCGLPRSPEDFEALLALATYPNLYLKWSHAPLMFGADRFPFEKSRPHLARALAAFGRERLMWGSDFEAIAHIPLVLEDPLLLYTWAEALFSILCNPELSEGDQEWLLARTARKVLGWPA